MGSINIPTDTVLNIPSGKLIRKENEILNKYYSNIVGWWDYSDTSTLTFNGSKISNVTDKSSAGNDLLNITDNDRPTYVADDMTGRGMAYFSSINQNLWTGGSATSLPTTDITFFVAVKSATDGSAYSFTTCIGNVDANRINIHLPWSDNTIYWDFGNYGSGGRLTKAFSSSTYTYSTQKVEIFCFQSKSGVGQTIYHNGELVASDGNTSTFVNPSSYPFGMGFHAGLKVGESIMFNSSLSEYEIKDVSNYLSKKWQGFYNLGENLKAWYDFTNVSYGTFTSNNVDAWKTLGNLSNKLLIKYSDDTRPTYQNGGLYFDGTTKTLYNSAGETTYATGTVLAVLKIETGGDNGKTLINGGGYSTRVKQINYHELGYTRYGVLDYWFNAVAPDYNTKQLYVFKYNNATSTTSCKKAKGTWQNMNTGLSYMGMGWIGARNGTSTDDRYKGYMYEIMAFDKVLTDAEVETVSNVLIDKHGIQI